MPDTIGALETQLRARLDEITPRAWRSEQLQQWIYDGAKDIARNTECLRTTAAITAVSGTQSYTMPADVVRFHRVDYAPEAGNENIPLEYRDFQSMDAVWWTQQTVAVSRPVLCTSWGYPPNLVLTLYPTPDDNGTINVYYYKLPINPFIDLSDPDDPVPQTDPVIVNATDLDLPEGWSDCALDYAEAAALRRDGDTRWQDSMTFYQNHREDLRVTALRFNDQAGMIDADYAGNAVPRWIWDENYA